MYNCEVFGQYDGGRVLFHTRVVSEQQLVQSTYHKFFPLVASTELVAIISAIRLKYQRRRRQSGKSWSRKRKGENWRHCRKWELHLHDKWDILSCYHRKLGAKELGHKCATLWGEIWNGWGETELLLQCRPGPSSGWKAITDDCIPSSLHSNVCEGVRIASSSLLGGTWQGGTTLSYPIILNLPNLSFICSQCPIAHNSTPQPSVADIQLDAPSLWTHLSSEDRSDLIQPSDLIVLEEDAAILQYRSLHRVLLWLSCSSS